MSDELLPKRRTHCDTPNETLEDIHDEVTAIFERRIAEAEARGEWPGHIAWLKEMRDKMDDVLCG